MVLEPIDMQSGVETSDTDERSALACEFEGAVPMYDIPSIK